MKQGKRLKAAYGAIDTTKSYPLDAAIRLIKSAPKAKFDPSHPRVKNYEAKLQRQQAKVAKTHGAKAEISFQRAVNAFVAELTAEEAQAIAKDPAVLGVAPDEQVAPDYSSTEFLGLPGKKGTWKSVYGRKRGRVRLSRLATKAMAFQCSGAMG